LFEKGFVEELFVNNIARIARFRNRLAYAYRRLSLEELLEEAMWFRVEIRKILAKIMSKAESSGVDPKMIIDEKLRKVLQSIGSRYEKIVAFILFGSRARGDYVEDSDWDIAILASQSLKEEELEDIVNEIAKNFGIPVDRVDLVDLSQALNELIYKVLRDGKTLYVKDWNMYRRIVLWEYIRVLDEEDGFMQTYFKRLSNKLK
jgi:predicted nucleotidyltransferase